MYGIKLLFQILSKNQKTPIAIINIEIGIDIVLSGQLSFISANFIKNKLIKMIVICPNSKPKLNDNNDKIN